VEVVNLLNSFESENAIIELLNVDFFRGVLHDDVNAFEENGNGGQQDQTGEQEGANRICNLPFGLNLDNNGSGNDSNALHHISEDMNNSCADVHVLIDIVLLLLLNGPI